MKTSSFRYFLGLVITLNCTMRTASAAGVVSSCTDAALRAALVGGGTVTFACDGTITLTNTLVLTNATVVDGTGHTITLSGSNAVRLISVSTGVSASFINLTLANGRAAGANGVVGPPVTDGQPGLGGAILNNEGTIALTGCTVVSNLAIGGAGYSTPNFSPLSSVGGVGQGGAIYNWAGNLAVTNCSSSANTATGGAGGFWSAQGYAGGDAGGGAIFSQGGSLTIQSSTFVSQTTRGGAPGTPVIAMPGQAGSGLGGAVWSGNATVNCYNSTFINNLTVGADLPYSGSPGGAGSGMGGAVFATNGVLNCFGCTFSTNTVIAGFKTRYGAVSRAQGGAIWSQAALSIAQCAFLGNQATNKGGSSIDYPLGESSGGAIYNASTLALSGSTFAQNTARGGNGGIVGTAPQPGGIAKGAAICSPGTLAATNCTFVANTVAGGQAPFSTIASAAGGDAAGGGLFNNGSATLVNLTFAANSTTGGAGSPGVGSAPPPGPNGLSLGGAVCNTNGTVNLYNTIVAHSASSSNCWGTMSDLGYNLSSDNSAGFYMTGSLNNTDPILGPLDNYGGPTLTVPLLTGSPAIDGGSTATAPATDQRGRSRPYGAAADIGAFESSPPYFIGGQVSGQTLRDEVSIVLGAASLPTTNLGHYGASVIPAGTYAITPTSPDYLFIPASRPVTAGPDQFGFNFQAYHWNAMSLEAVSNGVIHCLIANSNGLSCRVLTSTDLIEWLPISTNAAGPSNYFEAFLPITGEPRRYYRTAIP